MKKEEKKKTAGVRFEEDKEDFSKLLEDYPLTPQVLKEKETKKHPRKVSLNKKSVVIIDLHGMTLDEAKDFLDKEITKKTNEEKKPVSFKIITGKGLHSYRSKAKLPYLIHDYVRKKYNDSLIYIEESPGDVLLNGVPFRGHFLVTLKKK